MRFDLKYLINTWGALVIALSAFVVSIFAASYAKRAADASERQARGAEAQAHAIPAQLAAAEAAAQAAMRQADIAIRTAEEAKESALLSEAQMKASLQPILIFERRPPSLRDPIDSIVNTADGIAMNIAARYGTGIPPDTLQVPNVLAAHKETQIRVDWARVPIETIYIFYESQDGFDRSQQPRSNLNSAVWEAMQLRIAPG
jgi:multidrug efflux pump subunit AcrA (membrane-fusion protein)